METRYIDRDGGRLAYDDTGRGGRLIVLLPGAGDIRSEYRFVTADLLAGGARVVSMDLRGHGDSSASWPGYGVAESAGDLVALIEALDAGPATVVATSFSPAAALWAAADRRDLFSGLVLVSPHLESAPAWQRVLLDVALRGRFAGRLWASQYRSWHPAAPPADLETHAAELAAMLDDPQRRHAVRRTLGAHRDGLAERIVGLGIPALVIMGGADSHFKDPAAEGASMARLVDGRLQMVPDAGHYPQVEFPGQVATAVVDFLAETVS